MRSAALAIALLALGLVLPEGARACAVCAGGGTEETRTAFLVTTVFLSVLPPAIVGGLVLWLWRRSRRREEPSRQGAGPSGASVPVAAR